MLGETEFTLDIRPTFVGIQEGMANQNPEQKARDLIDRKLFGDKADVLQEGLKAALAV